MLAAALAAPDRADDRVEHVVHGHAPAGHEAEPRVDLPPHVGVGRSGAGIGPRHAPVADGREQHGAHGDQDGGDDVPARLLADHAEQRHGRRGLDQNDAVKYQVPQPQSPPQVGLAARNIRACTRHSVGGTGRDTMYGGWGNDLLNADDNLTTDGGLNDVGTDTNPSYEDRAYGGAGLDVLIAQHRRRPADRLDRRVQQLPGAVRAVRHGDGEPHACSRSCPSSCTRSRERRAPTRSSPAHTAATRPATASRSASSALVLQQDAAWGDQTGGPRDPQAGNIAGRQARRPAHLRDQADQLARHRPARLAGAAAITVAPAAPTVEMAQFVSSDDQTLAPLVVTGAIGAAGELHASRAARGRSPAAASSAPTASSRSSSTSRRCPTALSPRLGDAHAERPDERGRDDDGDEGHRPSGLGRARASRLRRAAGHSAAPLTLTGDPGNYVIYELDGPGGTIIGDGYLDGTTGNADRPDRLHRLCRRRLHGHGQPVRQGGQRVARDPVDADADARHGCADGQLHRQRRRRRTPR